MSARLIRLLKAGIASTMSLGLKHVLGYAQ
jgi:hypothetical protein